MNLRLYQFTDDPAFANTTENNNTCPDPIREITTKKEAPTKGASYKFHNKSSALREIEVF
jgi:hypothetical protein